MHFDDNFMLSVWVLLYIYIMHKEVVNAVVDIKDTVKNIVSEFGLSIWFHYLSRCLIFYSLKYLLNINLCKKQICFLNM